MVPDHGTWGHRYWLIWSGVVFLSFIGPEVYALVTNWHNTLSASVWDMERFMPGQTVAKWTAWHLLFTGMLLVLFVWLLGHFAFGWWR